MKFLAGCVLVCLILSGLTLYKQKTFKKSCEEAGGITIISERTTRFTCMTKEAYERDFIKIKG